MNAYYKYGCALLYKAQEEADPLGAVPKKESEVKADSDKDGSVESGATGEPSATPAASKAGEAATSSTHLEKENELETDGVSSRALYCSMLFRLFSSDLLMRDAH